MEKRAQENLGIRKSLCKDSKGVFEKGNGLFGLKWRGVGGAGEGGEGSHRDG